MADILQGTTPSLEIKIDAHDFAVSDVTVFELTFRNGSNTYIKGLSDVSLDTQRNSFLYRFTQEETLALDVRQQLEYQCRFKFSDNSVVGTVKARISVKDLISEETI